MCTLVSIAARPAGDGIRRSGIAEGRAIFAEWDNFYLIIGTAAGALIGLMFVVATLTAGLEASLLGAGTQTFFTPIVFHFTLVVVVSALTAVPGVSPLVAALILAPCAAVGFVYSARTAGRILSPKWRDRVHWTDKWFYGILPALDYLALAAAALAFWLVPEAATYIAGAAMLTLLLIGIRNAWDLAIDMLKRAHARSPDGHP